MIKSEISTVRHRYSDFRWFIPNRYLRLLVATGRFQKIHYGHLLYLRKALFKAIDTGCRFRIITGPSDDEYRTQPELKGSTNSFIPFSERQFLLSLLLSIPSKCIVEGLGRPSSEIRSMDDLRLKPEKVKKHHEQTNHWVENFFHPINITAADGVSSKINLFVTTKEEDKIYHESYTDGPVHPIYLVSNYWNNTEHVEVYNPEPIKNTSGTIIRSSNLDFNDLCVCETIPAAAYAAEELIKMNILGLRFRKHLSRIHKQFGFGSYVPRQIDL